MATKSQAYDHPAYEVPVVFSANLATTRNATSLKFVAFTQMLLKAANIVATVIGTAGGTDAANASVATIRISGTSTSTLNVSTIGSGYVNGTYTNTNIALSLTTLSQGDLVYFKKGTDTALAADASLEMYVLPGANLTV